MKYQCIQAECGHIFKGTKFSSNVTCPNCGGAVKPAKTTKPGGFWKFLKNKKVIIPLLIIGVLVLVRTCTTDPEVEDSKPAPKASKYQVYLKYDNNKPKPISSIRVIESNMCEVVFVDKHDTKKTRSFKVFKNKIDFSGTSHPEKDQIIQIKDGVIAPCFNDSDTVKIKVYWNESQKKFLDVQSRRKGDEGHVLTFISKRGDHKKASCYSKPEIESVVNVSGSCTIEVKIKGQSCAENKNLEISITGKEGPFLNQNSFPWKEEYIDQKKDVWARVKGNEDETLISYRNNGEEWEYICKPLDPAILEQEAKAVKQIINNFLNKPTYDMLLDDNLSSRRSLSCSPNVQIFLNTSYTNPETGAEFSAGVAYGFSDLFQGLAIDDEIPTGLKVIGQPEMFMDRVCVKKIVIGK